MISLTTPRAVYTASAADDKWADPDGEFAGGRAANLAYGLFARKHLRR